MTFTQLAESVLATALVALLIVRQLRWTPLDTGRMWRMPLIVGVIGVATLLSGRDAARTLSELDLALLLVGLVVALATGALMGRIAVFRPLASERRDQLAARHPGRAVPGLESRTGWVGLVLWLVLIAARIGLAVLGAHLGSAIDASSGVILLTVAANRAARAGVLQLRLQQLRPAPVA